MSPLRNLSRRKTLWLSFVAVVLPLVVLLGFQYRWLVQLEKSEAIANQAMLENFLEAVTNEVRYAYATNAERGLNLPPSLFREVPDIDKVSQYLRKREIWGARWLFIVFIPGGDRPAEVVFFDPACSCWGEPDRSEDFQAVHVAAAPWVMLGIERAVVEIADVQVDERDPSVRIILNPITDERRHVVGLAGMVLDPEYFSSQLLPMAVEKSLSSFQGSAGSTRLHLSVLDDFGQRVFSTGNTEVGGAVMTDLSGSDPAARRPFSFVFSDWAVELDSDVLSAREWARGNLLLNLSLSALLGVVLLGGAVFTLRTATREVRLSRMKSDFVSNVSHELRTPLASIRAFGEFLRLRRVSSLDKAAEYGEYIETESRRLTQLINNILDFSKIESGQKSYLFHTLDLAELLGEALETFGVRARQDGFEVQYENLSAGPVWVRADAPAILQAVSNLLDNAVKYSRDRREIIVRFEATSRRAVISVRDFGVGISREEQRKVFDRFHRVSTGLVHDVRGSGLGLAIVHHIVNAHEGDVSVLSELGRGSTFYIRLPRADPELTADGGDDEA